ncbi:MAG TPA: DUF362 domain-containing protein [Candidatus Brocadiia bacterium]|nr:DUF362 domain-containing protein [Candidatus Brocadiia bacterium]
MMDGAPGISRRRLLARAAGAAASAGFAGLTGGRVLAEGRKTARVVVARDDAVRTDDATLNPGEIRKMLDEAVRRLTDAKDARSAWGALFSKHDVVAVKVNCLGMGTNPAVALAVAEGIVSAGAPWGNIIFWDRSDRELSAAGFEIQTGSARLRAFGTDNPAGGGYGNEIEFAGSVGSLFSRILTGAATAVVSVPALKDHDLAGASLGMKNFFGAIHNPNKYHGNNCDPYIAELCSHPCIAKKLRLVVVDGTLALANGGPALNRKFAWNYNGLIVGKDMVAVDRVGVDTIEARRKELQLPTLEKLGRAPKYIETAAKLGLGIAAEASIERVEI